MSHWSSRLLHGAVTSTSIRMSLWMAMGGGAFMVANLVLAGVLESEHFGRLALFEAVLVISVGLAPFGFDNLVVRREIEVNRRCLRRGVATALVTAVAAGALATLFYDFSTLASLLLGVSCVSGTIARLYSAHEQCLMRLNRSQLLNQLPNFVFAAGAIGIAAVDGETWITGAAVLAAGFALSALMGMWFNRSTSRASPKLEVADGHEGRWRKSLSFLGIIAAVLLLGHIDRLVVAGFLTLEDLATFAVVATIVGSPYRLLQRGIGYALMPRLRLAQGLDLRRRIIRRELALGAVLGLAGGAVLALVAGPLISALYGNKYEVSVGLVFAIVLVGVFKIMHGVTAAALSALGRARQLQQFTGLSWLATGASFGAAAMLSSAGLVGVILGSATGWLVGFVAAALLVRSRLDPGVPVEARTQSSVRKRGLTLAEEGSHIDLA